MDNIYEDIAHIDVGGEVLKLEEQNKRLAEYICKLEGDIKRLGAEVATMKETQQNLSRNISELFKTAKLEIQRKDRIISDLRQEMDNMIFRRGSTFNKSKRPLLENKNDEGCKRFKNNIYEDKNAVQINKRDDSPKRTNKADISVPKNKKDSSSSRSTPDSIRVDKYQNGDKRASGSNKCCKNDNDYSKNSRYPSPTSFQRNMGSNNRTRPDNKYVRNRSNDRQSHREKRNNEHRRSRSNERYDKNSKPDRYKRSRSNNRWQDRKNIEQRNVHESCSSRYNRSRSKSFGRNKTPSRDLANNNEHKLEYRKKSNYLNSQSNRSKINEVLDLTDDTLEDGEITGESDNLVIEEPSKKTKYVADEKTKSLTIEEYRSRKKNGSDAEAKESNIPSQATMKESNKNPLKANKIADEDSSKNNEDDKLLIPKIEENRKPQSNIHIENIVKTEIAFESTEETDNALEPSAERIKTTIEGSLVKLEKSEKIDNTCEPNNKQLNNSSLNDSANSTSKLLSGDDSKISNNSSFTGNNDSISSHNNSMNTTIRQRRRRCVVIGLKEKV